MTTETSGNTSATGYHASMRGTIAAAPKASRPSQRNLNRQLAAAQLAIVGASRERGGITPHTASDSHLGKDTAEAN